MSPAEIARAKAFLEAWDPDAEVLPDWVADALDEEPSLAALFDARFARWDARGLGGIAPARPARRSWPGVALLAASLLGVVGLGAAGLLAREVGGDAAPVVVVSSPEIVARLETPPDPEPDGADDVSGDVTLPKADLHPGDNVRSSLAHRETAGQGEVTRWSRTRPTDEERVAAVVEEDVEDPNVLGRIGQVEVTKQSITVAERVGFAGGGTTPSAGSAPLLDEVAKVILENPQLAIRIEGHTDSTGAEAFNQRVSEQRAVAVRDALVARGVPAERLHAIGYGENRPIDSNQTAEGRAKNARVEFLVAEGEPQPPAPVPVVVEPTEDYTDYGHHSFVRTLDDPLSTFSIDVDTASYAIARRKLGEGWLPPAAAVRVEEFVNAFPYDYDRPPEGAPFGVDAEGAPNPFNARTHLVRIGVQGKRVAVDQRKPVHLTFLVDTSGSMQSDDKIGLLKRSLAELVGELRDGDTVAIVAYAGSAGVVLPPTPMSSKEVVLEALQRLEAGGSTAMGEGLALAYRLADEQRHDGAIDRVVLLSDGDANVGVTTHAELVAMIRGYADRGITLTTAGFGDGNYKDTMMERLANDGDGNYWYIDSIEQARRVFVDRLTSTLVVIARDVKLQVDWDPGAVEAYRLVGYENRDIADEDFRDDAVDAGEIGAGHQVTALYEVALRADVTPSHLATVRVRSKPPGPDAPAVERTYELDAELLRPSFAEGSADLRLAVAAASFAELLRGSPHLHGASYADVAAIARAARRVEYEQDDLELVRLIERAAELSRR